MISPIHTWVAEKTGLKENLTPETLQAWQLEKLHTVIDYAAHYSKFYQNKIGLFSKITDLPFTYPSEIASDPFSFLALPPHEVQRIVTLANSGTTPLRKRIFFSTLDLERTKYFFTAGMKSIVEAGDTIQILISNKTENSLGSLLSESLSAINVKSNITGAIKNVQQAIEVSKNADCLVGMPVELFYMSKIAPDMKPKRVLLAADITSPAIVTGIRNNWQCDVYFHYGHSEFGYGCAVDCPYHDGLHLRDVDLIFEIINIKTDKPAKSGELGEITITTLSNEAMPLIRYRTGHLSRTINTVCKCGSPLFRLGNIEGRISDQIFINEACTLSLYLLDEILFTDPFIRNYEPVLVKEKNRFILNLTIDSTSKIDVCRIVSFLPKEISLNVSYGLCDPFKNRKKRRLPFFQLS